MRSPTRYKFRHYRPGEDGVSRMLWASDGPKRSEEISDGIVKGSAEDLEIIQSQMWTPNELANEGEIAMLEAFFGTGSAPTTLYFRLWVSGLTDTSTLAQATETSGTDYATEAAGTALTKDTNWTSPAAGPTGTTSDVETFTAGGTWTAATQLALATVATGTSGDLIAFAALSTSRTLLINDTLDVSMQVALD